MTTQQDGPKARLNYVEFCVPETGAAKAFYEKTFGWALTDFGPTYAATMNGDTDIGLQADSPDGAKPPLPVIQVADLEAALDRALAAGAVLVTPIFSFPGGRRFHVRDPGGNEIAVMAGE
jgi:predicted enzyme related to lactoylglutathione lyase